MPRAVLAILAVFAFSYPCLAEDSEMDALQRLFSDIEAIKKRLDAIEKRLDRLDGWSDDEKAAQAPQGFRPPIDKPDRDLYSGLKLPAEPSAEEIAAYVSAIRARSMNRSSWSSSDPEVKMLLKVGRAGVSALIDEMKNAPVSAFEDYCIYALEALAGDEHRELIIENLLNCRELVRVVAARGWIEQAREILLDGIAPPAAWMPVEWIKAIVMLRDPSTYSALIEYLRTCPAPHAVYEEMAGLPGLPAEALDAAVSDIWRRYSSKVSLGLDHDIDLAARMAALHGHIDALGRLMWLLDASVGSTMSVYSGLEGYVRTLIPFDGPKTAIKAWFDANREKLGFDRGKKRYFVKEK